VTVTQWPLFADLPEVPDPAGSLAIDLPDWRYSSSAAAGHGYGRLRLFLPGCGGTLAIVTETGRGATVTNSDAEIVAALHELTRSVGRDPARLAVLEHWPAAESGHAGEHVDQMSGRVVWRRVFPLDDGDLPAEQRALRDWWDRFGRALLD
jgi:hypothetical protein